VAHLGLAVARMKMLWSVPWQLPIRFARSPIHHPLWSWIVRSRS